MTFIQAEVFGGGGGNAQGMILDANTACLWRLTEDDWTGTMTDIGYMGIDLTAANPSLIPGPALYPGMGKSLVAINPVGGADNLENLDAGSALKNLITTGPWTVEFWFVIGAGNVNAGYAVPFWIQRDTILDSGSLVQLALQPSTQLLRYQSETGVTTTENFSGIWTTSPQQLYPMHFGLVADDEGATLAISVYINGVQQGLTRTGIAKPTTLGSSCRFRMNAYGGYGSTGEMRVSNIARTDTEILESYTRGSAL